MGRTTKTIAVFCALLIYASLPTIASDELIKEVSFSSTEALVVMRGVETAKSVSHAIPSPSTTLTPYTYKLLLRSGTGTTEIDSFPGGYKEIPSGAGPAFWFEDAVMCGNNLYYLYVLDMKLQLGMAFKNAAGGFATHHAPFPPEYNHILNGYFTKDANGNVIVALPIPAHGPRYQSAYNAFKITADGAPVEIVP